MHSNHLAVPFKIASAICILLVLSGCKRSTPTEETPKAGETKITESQELSAEQNTNPANAPKQDKYRSVSSELEATPSDSKDKTFCGKRTFLGLEKLYKYCECGDITIPEGTECIDGMPACDGRKAVTAIQGFGCFEDENDDPPKNAADKKVDYLCGLTWGCDLGNGKKCKYTQKLVNGECVSTVAPAKGDFVCEEGNCACGDGFCALGAKCVQGNCECGYSDISTHCPDGCDEDDEFDLCDKCQSEEIIGVTSQHHGEFVCDYRADGSTESSSKVYYHLCNNPDGCYIGDMHFANGAIDYTGSSTRPTEDFGDWNLRYVKSDGYGCPYHIDGDTDTSMETLCPMGDCVIPKKDGHCGTIGMEPSAFHKVEIQHGKEEHTIYNAEACPGGTRWCHGRDNAPEIVPAGDSNYGCYKVPKIGNPLGLRVWVCDDEAGCVCGNELCLNNMICTNNHCISQNEYIKKMGKPYDTGYPKSAYNRPLYDPNFYTTDPTELDRCGRKSAEEFVQRWEPSINMAAIVKAVGHEIEFDPCLTRRICDSWPVPRKDRSKYVCEHGLYAQKTADGRMMFADRPLGLRCIAPDECPCGQRYGMEITVDAGNFCLSDTFDDGSRSVYDSISQNAQCKWEIGKDIDSQYNFWHNYVNSVDSSDFFKCNR